MLWCCRLFAVILLAGIARAADPAPAPQPDVVTVCEILASPEQYDHKDVFVLGRVSKRENGRWVGQDACEGMAGGPKALTIHFDRQAGPLPPDQFALNTALAKVKFREAAEHTKLREFRFGSGDYDRWAIVFGRVTFADKPADTPSLDAASKAGSVLCRGEAMVFLWGGSVY